MTLAFGRNRVLLSAVRDQLVGVQIHECRSDVDADRTIVAFTGDPGQTKTVVGSVLDTVLPAVDLRSRKASFPMRGVVDPIEVIGPCNEILDRFVSPEQADMGIVPPDPAFGYLILNARTPFVRFFLDFQGESGTVRQLACDAASEFLGATFRAYSRPSFGSERLLADVRSPDKIEPDVIAAWVENRACLQGLNLQGKGLEGFILQSDTLGARSIPIRPEQVVAFNGSL